MLSAEPCLDAQQGLWTLQGVLLDLHFFCQNSPFSVTFLPMISFSFLSICCMCCGPLMQVQHQPRTATLLALVWQTTESLTSSGPSTSMNEGIRGITCYPIGQRGYGISLVVDCPCLGGTRVCRCTSHPTLLSLSPLLTRFKCVQLCQCSPQSC